MLQVNLEILQERLFSKNFAFLFKYAAGGHNPGPVVVQEKYIIIFIIIKWGKDRILEFAVVILIFLTSLRQQWFFLVEQNLYIQYE